VTRAEETEIIVGAAVFVISLVGSVVIVGAVISRLPRDFLSRHGSAPQPSLPVRIGKNLLGVLLVVAGAIMSLPGVPGQGVLTMIVGLLLIDFPGKRAVERRIFSKPVVMNGLNRLRSRLGKEPLDPPPTAAAGAPR
jgi:hypothetical protein